MTSVAKCLLPVYVGLAVLAGTGWARAQVPGTIPFTPPPPATGTATYNCTKPDGTTTTFTAQFFPLSLQDCDPHPGAPTVTVSCDAAGRATPTISSVKCGRVVITQAPKGSTITVETEDHATVEVQVSDVTVVIKQLLPSLRPDVIIKSANSVSVTFTGDGIGTLTFDDADDCHVTASSGATGHELDPPDGSIEEVKFTRDSDDNKVKSEGDQPAASADSNSNGNHVNGKKQPFEKKPKKD